MAKKLFISDPKKLLLAVAQVIEDHPEVHTTMLNARDKNENWALAESSEACKFCAVGMMRRMVAERTISKTTAMKATTIFKCKTGYNMAIANDYKPRERFVGMLRKAAE